MNRIAAREDRSRAKMIVILRRRVQEALGRLSEADRELLALRYLKQLRMKEIAGILETTEGAVKTRHTRALRRLHGLLDRGRPDGASDQ